MELHLDLKHKLYIIALYIIHYILNINFISGKVQLNTYSVGIHNQGYSIKCQSSLQ